MKCIFCFFCVSLVMDLEQGTNNKNASKNPDGTKKLFSRVFNAIHFYIRLSAAFHSCQVYATKDCNQELDAVWQKK